MDNAIGLDYRPDPAKLARHIEDGEQRIVREFLGDDFYDALVTAAGGNGGETLTSHYATFWDAYLARLCADATVHAAVPFMATRITAQGVQQMQDVNAAPASSAAVKDLQQALWDRLQFLKQRAHDWLTDTSRAANYPLYPPNASVLDCDDDQGSLDDDLGVVF